MLGPWLAPVLTGIASTGGSLFGTAATSRSLSRQMAFQSHQNELAREEARLAREWAADLSSTEMQRRVADLRAAGLNPAMAMESGRGASTPSATISGATASGGSQVVQDPISPGIANALSAKRMQMEMGSWKAGLMKTEADTTKTQADTITAFEHADWLRAQRRQIDQSIGFKGQSQPFELRLAASQALLSELMQAGARNESEFNEMLGVLRPALGAVSSSAGGIARILGGFRSLPRLGVRTPPPVRLRGPYEPR